MTVPIIMLFALPSICLRVLSLPIDLYYSIFVICGIAFLWIYGRRTSLNLRLALKSGWALGLISAVFIGMAILSYSISINDNPIQFELNIATLVVLWWGVVFGLIGTALISAFPFIAAWRAFAGSNPGNFRKIGVSVIAIIAITATSLSYSVGIVGFDKEKVIYNAKMNLLTGIPTLLTGNPFASPIAGAFLYSGENLLLENGTINNAKIKLATRKTGGTD